MDSYLIGSMPKFFCYTDGIRTALGRYLLHLSQHPKEFVELQDAKWCSGNAKEEIRQILERIRPRLSPEKVIKLLECIRSQSNLFTLYYVQKTKKPPYCNFFFLLQSNYRQNWATECPICYRDDIMGNYRLFAFMFRPCGHVICEFCFPILCANRGKENFVDFFGVGCDVSFDEKTASRMICPFCREKIQSAFRTDKVIFPLEFIPTTLVTFIIENCSEPMDIRY